MPVISAFFIEDVSPIFGYFAQFGLGLRSKPASDFAHCGLDLYSGQTSHAIRAKQPAAIEAKRRWSFSHSLKVNCVSSLLFHFLVCLRDSLFGLSL
jgi:hypothetical protein